MKGFPLKQNFYHLRARDYPGLRHPPRDLSNVPKKPASSGPGRQALALLCMSFLLDIMTVCRSGYKNPSRAHQRSPCKGAYRSWRRCQYCLELLQNLSLKVREREQRFMSAIDISAYPKVAGKEGARADEANVNKDSGEKLSMAGPGIRPLVAGITVASGP
jgi:hypothetical protein